MELARRTVEWLLERRGYRLELSNASPRGFDNFLDLAKRNGLAPGAIIDIGIGFGTPWLYDAFPGVPLYLFEALASFKDSLDRIAAERGARYEICALGDEEGEIDLHVPTRATGSSILPRTAEQAARMHDHVDKVRTRLRHLDSFEFAPPPFLIKIDVEGAELKVLRGGRKTLRNTEMVILEASIKARHQGEADLTDLAHFMKGEGFRLYDIIELSQAGNDGELLYADVAFRRERMI